MIYEPFLGGPPTPLYTRHARLTRGRASEHASGYYNILQCKHGPNSPFGPMPYRAVVVQWEV